MDVPNGHLQGVGFWDRHREHPTLTEEEGDALDESSKKIMGTDMHAIEYDSAQVEKYRVCRGNMPKEAQRSDAEERAFAEYMEDYGVDREEAEAQVLG